MKKRFWLACFLGVPLVVLDVSAEPKALPAPSAPSPTVKAQSPAVPSAKAPSAVNERERKKLTEGERLQKQASGARKRAAGFTRKAERMTKQGRTDAAAHYKKLAELSEAMAKEFETLTTSQ